MLKFTCLFLCLTTFGLISNSSAKVYVKCSSTYTAMNINPASSSSTPTKAPQVKQIIEFARYGVSGEKVSKTNCDQESQCFQELTDLNMKKESSDSSLRKTLICHLFHKTDVGIQVTMHYQCLDTDSSTEVKTSQLLEKPLPGSLPSIPTTSTYFNKFLNCPT